MDKKCLAPSWLWRVGRTYRGRWALTSPGHAGAALHLPHANSDPSVGDPAPPVGLGHRGPQDVPLSTAGEETGTRRGCPRDAAPLLGHEALQGPPVPGAFPKPPQEQGPAVALDPSLLRPPFPAVTKAAAASPV